MLRGADSWRVESSAALVAFILSATAALSISNLAAQPAGESRVVGGAGIGVGAGTLESALVLTYQCNPQLNSQRAATRAVDENVATALSGYRPKVSGTASLTEQYLDNVAKTTGAAGNPVYLQGKGAVVQSAFGMTATQTLYNGLQTGNRTRQAEGQVFAAREALRSTEQTVLLNAATVYMNLLRDAAVLELQRSNVNVLEVTLRQTRDRFTAGEVTRTDVAQAESSLAAGRAQLAAAESNYVTSRANFRQVICVEPPARLAAAMPVDRFFPRMLEAAVARSRTENPSITTAMYNVDVATLQVKIAEGALYPTLAAVGNVQKNYGGSTAQLVQPESLGASVAAQLTVPIYQGGAEYAAIRQSKETPGQQRLNLDLARDQVQAAVV
jgi:outer membrane protein